ncbi:MAG: oxidoreductase [Spirochaetae bacterium HGW-Spirochaetae-1]|jgi:PhzF family phenazine biosynthesis protein|nr:MAG: oxidoreductase [Spirochaetae bacterium HGW-Spirochaetae-1]
MIIFKVDAFTSEPYRGNPAGVCILEADIPDSDKQNIAMEMNLSETAFLQKRNDGYDLRWFTPAAEVELCGHATLASAHILWEESLLGANDEARFHTLSGLLTARKQGSWMTMDFPAEPEVETVMPPDIERVLGIKPVYAGKNRFDFIFEFESEEQVKDLRPDLNLLAILDCRGVIVTAPARDDYDFVSRFFAPRVGVSEDPVTGSAHCCLGPFWEKRTGEKAFRAFQCSARGGEVSVTVEGERVLLGGRAVTVMECRMR